jgi:hypothetical protein
MPANINRMASCKLRTDSRKVGALFWMIKSCPYLVAILWAI